MKETNQRDPNGKRNHRRRCIVLGIGVNQKKWKLGFSKKG